MWLKGRDGIGIERDFGDVEYLVQLLIRAWTKALMVKVERDGKPETWLWVESIYSVRWLNLDGRSEWLSDCTKLELTMASSPLITCQQLAAKSYWFWFWSIAWVLHTDCTSIPLVQVAVSAWIAAVSSYWCHSICFFPLAIYFPYDSDSDPFNLHFWSCYFPASFTYSMISYCF